MKQSFRKLSLSFIVVFAVLILILGTVTAHEGRMVGDYELDFGWQVEPALVGQLNGVELTITSVAQEAEASHEHGMDDMGHDTAMINLAEDTPAPEIHLNVSELDNGNVLVEYEVHNFDLSMEAMSGAYVEGQGHAHIIVDGVEVAMVAGNSFEIPNLEPGEHEIGLGLNANTHEALAIDGEPIQESVMFTVGGMDMGGDSEHSHSDEHADDTSDMNMADDHAHSEDSAPMIVADLQVEVTFGPASVVLPLLPGDEPGHYVATLIPTRAGDYTFRVFGTIGDVEVDEIFTSADGNFSTVEPISDVTFPDEIPSMVDLLEQIEALEARLGALESGD